MTLNELARRTGISPHTLRRKEEQRLQLDPDEAARIGIVTDLDAKALLEGKVLPRKRNRRSLRPRLDSAKLIFAMLVDEVLEKTERDQELFYHLFNSWISTIVDQLELRQILNRLHNAAREQGLCCIVPPGLLPQEENERRRWRQEHAKALFPVDGDGKLAESAFWKGYSKMVDSENERFRGAEPRAARHLEEMTDRKKTVRFSEKQDEQFGRLLEKRVRFSKKSAGVESRLG
jgi:transcriptional regulator with XRE-family HTH domain